MRLAGVFGAAYLGWDRSICQLKNQPLEDQEDLCSKFVDDFW